MLVVSLALLSAVPSAAPQQAWPPHPPVFPGVLLDISGVDHVITADLDGDGDLDLATIGDPPTSLRVHLGTGEGSFVADALPPASVPPGIILRGAVAADFDGDGDPDIALIGDVGLEGRLYSFLNDGNGALSLQTAQTFQKQGEALSATDVDGDGRADLLMIRNAGSGLQLLRSQGAAGFAAPQWIDPPVGWTLPRDFTVGDVDGDGSPDVVTLNYGTAPTPSTAFLYANDGLGGFQAPAPLFEVGDNFERVLLADLRGNGVLHAAVTGKLFAQPPTFAWYENDGASGFSLGQDLVGVSFPPELTRDLAVRDLDGDGRQEWILELESGNLGRFALQGSRLELVGDELAMTTGPWLAAGDFDCDGAEDLLGSQWVAFDAGTPALFRGDGSDGLRGVVVSASVPGGGPGRLHDIDGDGLPDLVVLDPYQEHVHLYRGLGTGRFEGPQSVPTHDWALDVALGDFDGNGLVDLALTEGLKPFVEILLQDAGGGFTSAGWTEPSSFPYEYSAQPAHVLDSDADGRDEVALYDWPVSSLLVIGLDAASSVQTLARLGFSEVKGIHGVTDAAPGVPQALELIAPGTASYLSLWVLAQPLASPPPAPIERLPLPLQTPAPQVKLLGLPQVRDLDGDGLRDVWAVLRASGPTVLTTASRWIGTPEGTFAPPQSDRTPFFVSPRWAEDVDGDGALDYGYAQGGSLAGNPNWTRLQVHRPALDAQLMRSETYPWLYHASGDVDGDGRLDLVVVVQGRVVSLLDLTGP